MPNLNQNFWSQRKKSSQVSSSQFKNIQAFQLWNGNFPIFYPLHILGKQHWNLCRNFSHQNLMIVSARGNWWMSFPKGRMSHQIYFPNIALCSVFCLLSHQCPNPNTNEANSQMNCFQGKLRSSFKLGWAIFCHPASKLLRNSCILFSLNSLDLASF
jgi:hypothetical protein